MVSPESSNINPEQVSQGFPTPASSSSTAQSDTLADFAYLVLGILANAAIWIIALTYLRIAKPSFVSTWAVSLPGGGLTSNVDLPQIGSADTRVNSPYTNVNRDPRENYKFLATSRPVLLTASESLDISIVELGRPRVEIVDNTTLMELSIQGKTPEDAQTRANAVHTALLERVAYLREEEAAQQDEGSRAILEESREKLERAQERLSEFKARTGLVSAEQISHLSSNIERLRERQVSVQAERSSADSRLQELSDSLDVSVDEAAQAFVLRADQIFQKSVEEHSAATTELDALNAQFGRNHPSVIRARGRQEAASAAMIDRASSLLGESVNQQTVARLNVGSDFERSSREGLFEEAVMAHVQAQGLTAQSTELQDQVEALEDKLTTLAQYGSVLESLQRDITIAEAIFSSTIARLDLGRSDVFGSYPHIQLLTEPSLPADKNTPSRIFIYIGALLGSVFTTAGVILLWRQSLVWRAGERLGGGSDQYYDINVDDNMTLSDGHITHDESTNEDEQEESIV